MGLRSRSDHMHKSYIAMASPSDEAALESLLDDALAGFDTGHAGRAATEAAPREAPLAPAASSSTQASDLQAIPAAASAAATAQPASYGNTGSGSSSSKAPGLKFDPLGQRPGKPAARAGGSGLPSAATHASGAAGLPAGLGAELDDLPEGLSRLLEELARADLGALSGSAGASSSSASSSGAGTSQQPAGQPAQQRRQQQQQGGGVQDLAATLRALEEQAPSFTKEGELPEDALRELAQQLQSLAGGLERAGAEGVGLSGGAGAAGSMGGAGGEGPPPPEMTALVDSLMQQLLSKEVLYQPMKDIGERYSPWLEANKEKLSDEELQRYREQHEYIKRICHLYETQPENYQELVVLVQEMQALGQPPQEIVDELAPGGLKMGPDGLPSLGGGAGGLPPELSDCCIQ